MVHTCRHHRHSSLARDVRPAWFRSAYTAASYSFAHISSAARTLLSKTCRSNGFTRNSAAPSLIACIRALASPCAVMKMIGVSSRSALSLACSSRPDIPGIRISSIRHAALFCRPDSRNSFADPKHRAESPSASIRSWSALWTDSSSSTITMNLVLGAPAMRRT